MKSNNIYVNENEMFVFRGFVGLKGGMNDNEFIELLTKWKLSNETNRDGIKYVTVFEELGFDDIKEWRYLTDEDFQVIKFRRRHSKTFKTRIAEDFSKKENPYYICTNLNY